VPVFFSHVSIHRSKAGHEVWNGRRVRWTGYANQTMGGLFTSLKSGFEFGDGPQSAVRTDGLGAQLTVLHPGRVVHRPPNRNIGGIP